MGPCPGGRGRRLKVCTHVHVHTTVTTGSTHQPEKYSSRIYVTDSTVHNMIPDHVAL